MRAKFSIIDVHNIFCKNDNPEKDNHYGVKQ
jgi:hypothetical protein